MDVAKSYIEGVRGLSARVLWRIGKLGNYGMQFVSNTHIFPDIFQV